MSLQSELEELEKCRAYVVSQLAANANNPGGIELRSPGPAITISLQCGSGAEEIARALARLLERDAKPGAPAWTVFNHDLVDQVIEEHHLPKELAKHMSEERRSYFQEVMDEFVGLRPPSWLLVPQIAETILHLADAGRVILVGWGANVITQRMPNVFHVRIIASLPKRIESVQRAQHLTAEEAVECIEKEDRGRGGYVRTHFHRRVDDDLLYHLVINTDALPREDAAALIAEGARRYFQHSNLERPSAAVYKTAEVT